ncbi:MAG: peptidoglycan DD-metalloendopeptidase family protein [Bacteroidales bacterium]|nr:peptidoglycan DD-metalloendopeptidase family protein [Bacteroidales bacterium]
MNFKTLLITSLLYSLCFAVSAQDNGADSLRRDFGRMSVSSSRSTSTPFADTLDTENPNIKVILFSNGTYRYVKDPEAAAESKVFTEHWDTRAVNPYHEEKSLPDRFSLWIVDTLDSYCCPNKTRPSSQFGYRHGRPHQGIDLPYPTGTPVYAAFDGKVRVSDYVGGYGNLVVIRHANGLETFYGHMSRRDVESGDWVNAGDVIGLGGSTGRSTGPHLHFETRYRGHAFDPAWLIDFETGTLRHRLMRFRSRYFNPNSRYVQTEEDEDEINRGDEQQKKLAEEKAKKEAQARAAAQRATQKYYTVRAGDTLGKIAKKNGTSVKALCRLNGIKETTTLQIGRRLRVR